MNRCKWCNLKNPIYVAYHDEEWGQLRTDEQYLYEMLILESFQAGLSWECVLNKREAFRSSFDNFDIMKVSNYKEDKIKVISEVLTEKFDKVKEGKGIAYTIPMKSLIGVSIYQFLPNNQTKKEEK